MQVIRNYSRADEKLFKPTSTREVIDGAMRKVEYIHYVPGIIYRNFDPNERPMSARSMRTESETSELSVIEGTPDGETIRYVSARMKLVIPHPKTMMNCKFERHKRKFIEKLKELLSQSEIKIENETNNTDLEIEVDQLEQRVYTLSLKINSRCLPGSVLPLTRAFLKEVIDGGGDVAANPMLIFHSNEAFSCSLRSAMEVKLRAFFWGNILDGVFLNHWIVCMDRCKCHDAKMMPNAFLEFDRKNMINIMLTISEKKRGQQVEMNYKVTIEKDWIRRIIVDTNVDGESKTRIYFELNCPPKMEKHENNPGRFGKYERVTTIKHGRMGNEYPKDELANCPYFTLELEQSIEAHDIHVILSMLRMRTGLPIEFGTYTMEDHLIKMDRPYFGWCNEDKKDVVTSEKDKNYKSFLDKYLGEEVLSLQYKDEIDSILFPNKEPKPDYSQEELKNKKRKILKKIVREKRFIITYLIECLLSRGPKIKDQICLGLDPTKWLDFLQIVGEIVRDNGFSVAERCLERFITLLDENKQIGYIIDALDKIRDIIRKEDANPVAPNAEESREGYQRVRKIVITPTRIIYVVPEMMMSNRVLRKFDPSGIKILRVSFRDDDNLKMMLFKTGQFNIDRCVKERLINGVTIAGLDYGYLGSSNSQLRDHGAYFMLKMSYKDIEKWRKINESPPKDKIPQIELVRNTLGKFSEIESVPKMMARLGQCFTQSRLSGVRLPIENLAYIHDIIGSRNTQYNTFTFSDGVGCVSREFAKNMADDFGIKKSIPSCFQIRYRGLKGVLGVNTILDEHNKWIANLPDIGPLPEGLSSWIVHVALRSSQDKFYGAKQDFIEIVKVSSPSPVALNKPFINILDQVSFMQGPEVHKRMTERIEQLLDRQMRGLAKQMIDETHCRNKLKELPRRIDIDKLSLAAGFEMSNEVFFRSLMKAFVRYSVTRQLRKAQIQIPYDCGRTLLGIIDETGHLQYGQIFVQITNNIMNKHIASASKRVIKGTVLMTKNPCVVPGDVRIFEAVDIPELKHLIDVVVFPQHGHRPHPDEMAGSDLDGDEYCVIWDKEMLLIRNEEAFDFAAAKREDTKADQEESLQEKMANFYVDYMTLDAVGAVSNAHLAASDQYGINHKVCMDLAKKNSQALDFTKSGQCPKPLRKEWISDPETGEELPPEKSERNPDFQVDSKKPMYQSPRLLGKLYREIKMIEDVMRIGEEKDEQMKIELDKYLEIDGWDEYEETAEKELNKFISQFRGIMENYGIRTEAELFTGCMTDIRNRLSDKEADDMSFFNTNNLIETKVTNICRKIRENFFDDFGGWNMATQTLERTYSDEANIFHREVKSITTEMKKKASAYYICCYRRAQVTGERFLAFPWMLYEILAAIKQEAIRGDETFPIIGNPLFQLLETKVENYIEENEDAFEKFRRFDPDARLPKVAVNILKMYCKKYQGMDRLLFIVFEWGRHLKVRDSLFSPVHLPLLAIMYLINGFASIDGDGIRSIDPIPIITNIEDLVPENFGGLSKLLVKFFEFMASRKFGRMSNLHFSPLGFDSCFIRGEWVPYHRAAMTTYYNMVYNLRFEDLLLESDGRKETTEIIREMEPFAIELPTNIDSLDRVSNHLREKSRVVEVSLRRIAKSQIVMVSARGTLQSLDRLKSLVTVMPPVNLSGRGREFQQKIFNMVYEKIKRERTNLIDEEEEESEPEIWNAV